MAPHLLAEELFYGIDGAELLVRPPPKLQSSYEDDDCYGIALNCLYVRRWDGFFEQVEEVWPATFSCGWRRGNAQRLATFFLWQTWLSRRLQRFEAGLTKVDSRARTRRRERSIGAIKQHEAALAMRRAELRGISKPDVVARSARSAVARLRGFRLSEYQARAAIVGGGQLGIVVPQSDSVVIVARVTFPPTSPYGPWDFADAVVAPRALSVSFQTAKELHLSAADEALLRRAMRRSSFHAVTSESDILTELERGFSRTTVAFASEVEADSEEARCRAEITTLNDSLQLLKASTARTIERAKRRSNVARAVRSNREAISAQLFEIITSPFDHTHLETIQIDGDPGGRIAANIARHLNYRCSAIEKADRLGSKRRLELVEVISFAERALQARPTKELWLALRRARGVLAMH